MQRKFCFGLIHRKNSALALALAAQAVTLGSAFAASQTWDGEVDSNWNVGNNWIGNAVPGAINPTSDALSADVATFSGPLGLAINPILTDAGRNVRSISFNTASAGAYVIGTVGGNELQLGHTGNVTVNSTVVNAQVINAPIRVRLPSSTNGTYAFNSNSTTTTATLTLNSILSGSATTRPLTVTLGGTNTGENTVGSFSDAGAGALAIVKSGAGTWVISGPSTMGLQTDAGVTTGVTIDGGVLALANGSALGTNAANTIGVAINNTATLEVRNGITIDNGLSLNLNNGGTIRAVSTSATNGRINVGAAANTSVSINTVTSGDLYTIGNGSNDFTGGSSTSTVNIGGPGTVLLAQASDYAGGISIGNGSTLQTNSDTALGAAASANVTLVGTGKLKIGSTALRNHTITALNSTSSTATIETGFTGTSTLTVNTPASSISTYAGVLQNGTGTLALTKNGPGTLSLTGQSTNSGATLVRNGNLNLDFSAATAPSSNIASASSALTLGGGTGGAAGNPGGILSITGKASTANTQTFSNLALGAGSNKIAITPGASGTAGLTITNAITQPGNTSRATIVFPTTGTITLAGNPSVAKFGTPSGAVYATYGLDHFAATDAGGVVGPATYTTVAGGGVTDGVINDITTNSTEPSGTSKFGVTLRFNNATGVTLQNNNASFFANGILVTSNAGPTTIQGQQIRQAGSSAQPSSDLNIVQNSASDFTIASALNNNTTGRNMTLSKSGTGKLILTANNGYAAGTYINEGTVQVGTNGTTGALGTGGVVNYGSLIFNRSNALADGNLISGTGTLTQAGAGTTTLTVNTSTFTGDINVQSGVLAASLGNAAGTGTASAFGATNVARNINVNNGGTLRFDNGDILIGNGATPTAAIVINAGGIVTNNGASFNTLGAVNLNGGTLTGTGGSGNPQFQMYQLRGTVTAGGTTVSTISGSGNATAAYHLNGAINFNVADATSSAATDLAASASFIDGVGATPVAGGLTKTGAGTLTLSGASTYTGATTVSAGRLAVDGSITSPTTVNGGSLGGGGTITGAVTIASGGTLSPGNSIGQLIINGDTTLSGISDFEINASTLTSDKAAITGNLTYGGSLKITNLAGTLAAGQSWDLFDGTRVGATTFGNDDVFGTNGSTSGGLFPTLASGLEWSFDYGDGTLSIQSAATASISLTGTSEHANVATGGQITVSGLNNKYVSEIDELTTANATLGSAPVVTIGNELAGNDYVMLWMDSNATEIPGLNTNGGTIVTNADPQFAMLAAAYPGWDILISYPNFAGAKSVNFDLTGSGFAIDKIAVVPEPASVGLLGVAALGLISRRRRRQA